MWKDILSARMDGTVYLLWYPKLTLPKAIAESVDFGLCVDGWYAIDYEGIDSCWETAFGSIGEPSYYANIVCP